jgi:hypothetical protein
VYRAARGPDVGVSVRQDREALEDVKARNPDLRESLDCYYVGQFLGNHCSRHRHQEFSFQTDEDR